jgi:hypothetical protein
MIILSYSIALLTALNAQPQISQRCFSSTLVSPVPFTGTVLKCVGWAVMDGPVTINVTQCRVGGCVTSTAQWRVPKTNVAVWCSWNRASRYISIVKPTRCTIFKFIECHSTCFGRSFCPSSEVQDCTYSIRYMSYRLVDCMLYVQSWTPDDGWKDHLKHVEWYWINLKIVHLVGFTIEMLQFYCKHHWAAKHTAYCSNWYNLKHKIHTTSWGGREELMK